jgi:LacI family transcriptional regulator
VLHGTLQGKTAGIWSEGMKATLADVSKMAGVSTATVSRVINGSDLVGAATRKLVEAAICKLDYIPSHAARALARNRSDTLAVVFPRVESGYYAEILAGLYQEAAVGGFSLMTAFAHGEDPMLMRNLCDGRCDALIVLNLALPDGISQQLTGGNVPVVVINQELADSTVAMVGLDNAAGVRAMMEHLVGVRGFQDIAVIRGPEHNLDTQARLAEIAASGGRLGIACSEPWPGDFTEAGGHASMAAHLDAGRPLPEVVFALNDTMAYGVYLCLRERGLNVPRDLAVVGFDDLPASRVIGLTTVNASVREQGREACRVAIGLARGEIKPAKRLMKPSLVVRESCQRQ